MFSSNKVQKKVLLTDLCSKVYYFPMIKDEHGKTLFNLDIAISNNINLSGNSEIRFSVIVLLHEIGHVLARDSCESPQRVIES